MVGEGVDEGVVEGVDEGVVEEVEVEEEDKLLLLLLSLLLPLLLLLLLEWIAGCKTSRISRINLPIPNLFNSLFEKRVPKG